METLIWLVMKKSSVSRTQCFTYFQILCKALDRWARTHYRKLSGKTSWRGSKVHQNTEFGQNWWWAYGIRVEYFTRIHHIAALQQSPRVHVKMSDKPEESKGRIIFMSMFHDISWETQDNEQACESNANFVSIYARRFHQEDGHSSDLDQKRSGILIMTANHKEWDESLNWWW